MSAAQPSAAPRPVPSDDAIVRAYRVSQMKDGEEVDTAYYAARHKDQVGPHVLQWLEDKPEWDVHVSIDEIPWPEWRDAFLGDPEDVEAGTR